MSATTHHTWYYWIDVDRDWRAGRSNSRAHALSTARRYATHGPADMAPLRMRVLRSIERPGQEPQEDLIAEFAPGGRQIDGIELSESDFASFA